MSFLFPVRVSKYGPDTWIQSEEAAYPNGGKTRKGVAIFPDGSLRAIRAGIADTYFTIPASCRYRGRYVAGFLTVGEDDSGNLWFWPNH